MQDNITEEKEIHQDGEGWQLYREMFVAPYRVTCRHAYTIPDDYIERFGVISSGDLEWDRSHSLKIVTANITVAEMVAWYAMEREFNIYYNEDASFIWDKGIAWLEWCGEFLNPKTFMKVKSDPAKDQELMKDMYFLVAFLNHLKLDVSHQKGWDKLVVPARLGDMSRLFTRPGQQLREAAMSKVPEVKDLDLGYFLSERQIKETERYIQRTLL